MNNRVNGIIKKFELDWKKTVVVLIALEMDEMGV